MNVCVSLFYLSSCFVCLQECCSFPQPLPLWVRFWSPASCPRLSTQLMFPLVLSYIHRLQAPPSLCGRPIKIRLETEFKNRLKKKRINFRFNRGQVFRLASGFSSFLISVCMAAIFPEALSSVSFSSSSSCCLTSVLGSSGAVGSDDVSCELGSALLSEAGVEAWPSAVRDDFWDSWGVGQKSRLGEWPTAYKNKERPKKAD